MTRNQFIEMAENFADYANKEVSYKVSNPYYNYSGYGELSKHKYNKKQGFLRGVGTLGNTEYFIIIQRPGGGRSAVHYSDIAFPKK